MAALSLVLLGLVLRRTVFAQGPELVRTATVTRGSVESTITNSRAGTVEARTRAGLSTGTAGIVVALEVQRGARVKRGQTLLRLDDTKPQSELLYAQRQHEVALARNARACVTADRASRAWERNEALARESVVSEDRLDALRTTYDSALAECVVAAADVKMAAAAVEVAQAELDKTVLRAPFDAIIADVSIELGEWATPSVPLMAAPDLIDAIDPSSLYISAPMDEVDALLLHLDQRVRVTIDSHPDQSFRAHIVRLAPFVLDVEQQNRTLEIEVELDDTKLSSTLLPGTSADVEVILEVRSDVLRIPTYAVMEDDRVFIVQGEALVARQVETGIRNWNWTEITAGLVLGDEVVTSLERPGVVGGAQVAVETVEEEP